MSVREVIQSLCWIVFPGLWLLDVLCNYVDYLNEYPLLSAGYAFIAIVYIPCAAFIAADLLTDKIDQTTKRMKTKKQFYSENWYTLLRNGCALLALVLIAPCTLWPDLFGGVPLHYVGTGMGVLGIACLIEWKAQGAYDWYVKQVNKNPNDDLR